MFPNTDNYILLAWENSNTEIVIHMLDFIQTIKIISNVYVTHLLKFNEIVPFPTDDSNNNLNLNSWFIDLNDIKDYWTLFQELVIILTE